MFNYGITTIPLYYFVNELLILNKPNKTKEKITYLIFSVSIVDK